MFHKKGFELFLGGSGEVVKTYTSGKNRRSIDAIASDRVLIKEYRDAFSLGHGLGEDAIEGGVFVEVGVYLNRYEHAAYIARTMAAHLTPLNPSVAFHLIYDNGGMSAVERRFTAQNAKGDVSGHHSQ